MIDHSMMKLGKLPARHDARTLRLADYIDSGLKPPARIDWGAKLTQLGMMKNDELGDCTCAAAGHTIQAWTANNNSQIIIPDSAILKAYEDVGHYVPGDPSTDNGAVELDLLNYWRKTGIGGHKLYAFVAIEPHNKLHVELSVDLFGSAYLGVALPISAQRQRVWSVTGGADAIPGSWGGHAIDVVDYGPTGVTVVTWGQLKTMTWAFFFKYVDEAYGLLSSDWARPDRYGMAPSGFTFTQLQADLTQITG